MKKKSFNNKLKLQKENIVNLNQLNSIKGGIKPTLTITGLSDFCKTDEPYSVEPLETETCFAF